jgi:alpha-galactosidase
MKCLNPFFSLALFLICWSVSAQNFPLEKLNLELMSTGWEKAHVNRSIENNELSIGGKKFDKGVGTHANSSIRVSVDGKAKRFVALVGVDDEVGNKGSVRFLVFGDGKVLFDSKVISGSEAAKKIDVSLVGVKIVELQVTDSGNGNNSDHADWVDAKFVMAKGAKPAARPEGEVILIGNKKITLGLRVDKDGYLFQQYLGKATTSDSIFGKALSKQLAYPTIMSVKSFQSLGEPALHVIHYDGHTSTQLKYLSHKTTNLGNDIIETRIKLKDPNYNFFVDLCYKVYEDNGIIEQWSEIYHNETSAIQLVNFASVAISTKGTNQYLTYFTGEWAGEMDMQEEKIGLGSKVIENRWGITSSNGRQQHFILSLNGPAKENSGDVIMASLAWSGNWQLKFEQFYEGQVTSYAGMNPWSSQYTLEPNERFVTPALIYTYSDKGKGEASRHFHRWALNNRMRDGKKPLLTLVNNWETTGMDVREELIVPMFKPAKELGFELFLLDDGWFGLPDKARVLGEWNPSPKMLPNGTKGLTDKANAAGIDFGIWVEMEMADLPARLVKEHPDWLLHEANREKFLVRYGQYVLDMSNPQVQEFCLIQLDKLLNTNNDIKFVKWDSNSSFHNVFSTYLGLKQQHLWIDYTNGLYRVFDQCRKRHPDTEFMLCSAGGARCDYGALQYFNYFWPSDNTNAKRRVTMQWGYSQIFPAKAVAAHVTHMENPNIKFAFDVAMSGVLGMDINPLEMKEEEKEICKQSVELYKNKLRTIVQFGDQYRLLSPYENPRSAMNFVTEDKSKSVLFIYQIKDDLGGNTLRVKPQGLTPTKSYQIEEVNIIPGDKSICSENKTILTGSEIMKKGISLPLQKELQSAVILITAL